MGRGGAGFPCVHSPERGDQVTRLVGVSQNGSPGKRCSWGGQSLHKVPGVSVGSLKQALTWAERSPESKLGDVNLTVFS